MSQTSDVLVIGGGVFGCATAWSLARGGASVTLLDASTPGCATSASAGGLWPVGEALGLGCGVIFHAGDGGPQPLPRLFMDFLCASNRRFPVVADELREASGVNIEAEGDTGLLYLLFDEEDERSSRRILDWMGDDPSAAAMWTAAQVAERDPLVTRDIVGAVHFPGDHQVNPMLLADAFKRGAMSHGARFVPEARVIDLEVTARRVESVRSSAGSFAADAVVNAAGAWSPHIARMAGVDLPVTSVRGQIVCTETLAPGTLHSNLSTRDCYLLQKAHGEVLIGSTTEHVGFATDVRLEDLCRLAAGGKRAVPALEHAIVKRTWAGLRPGTPDEFPILGPCLEVDNLYHATGGFRTGIVSSPLCGEIVAAAVLGKEPPFPLDPFLAARFDDRVSS